MAKSRANNPGKPSGKDLLQSVIQGLEEDFEKGRYDSVQDVEKHIAWLYQRSVKLFRKVKTSSGTEVNLELNGKVGNRRKQAMSSCLMELRAKYEEAFPHIDIVDLFGRIDSSPLASFRRLEQRKAFMVGAAVWMIDELQRKNMLQEAGLCLTHDADEYLDVVLPEIHIPRISDELLMSMIYAIWHRNDSTNRKRSRDETNSQFDVLTEEAAVRGEPTVYTRPEREDEQDMASLKALYEQLTNREKFNAIISMLSQTRIERAVARFKKAAEDYCELCLRSADIWYNRCRKSADDIIRKIRRIGETEPRPIQPSPLLMNPLLRKPELPDLSVPPAPASGLMYQMNERDVLIEGMESRLIQHDELIKARNRVIMELKMVYDYYWKNPRSEAFGSECVEIMDTLEIDNPYEICFAFLYLLDSGNDLPWFHMASYAVVSKAAVMLPWGQMFDAYDNCWDEDDDETYFDESEEEPEDSQYDPAEEKKEYKQYLENPPDLIDREKEIYRQKYRRIDDEWRKEHLGVESENCNLPQFVFELSNVVLPRDPRFSGCDAREFTESGFSEDEAGILLYLNTLANESKYRDYDWSDYLFSDYSVEEEEDDQEDKGEEVELEALKKQNKAYKSELDRLRSQIHDLQKEKKTAENETAKIREENALEHQELVDLREAIFNWEHGEQETAEEISIELPYETKTRMIVFGGHDSWIKAIRPMLPDVRFVDKDMIPKAETIRNAGIVWIQPNAISHAYYYKIMDIVRQHKIPVRYFTNASAEKCARQLAMADIKNRQ